MSETNEIFFNTINNKPPKNKWFWGNHKFSKRDCNDFKFMKFFLFFSMFIPNLLFLFKSDLKTYYDFPTFSFIIREGFFRNINIILLFFVYFIFINFSIRRNAKGLQTYLLLNSICTIGFIIYPENNMDQDIIHQIFAFPQIFLIILLFKNIKNFNYFYIKIILTTFILLFDIFYYKTFNLQKYKCIYEHIILYHLSLNFNPVLE